MKSSVENVVPYQSILVPEDKLTVSIPSWEAVSRPLIDQAIRQYEAMTGEPVRELTDRMIEALNLPGIAKVSELKRYGMDLFQKNETQLKFYNEVLPHILTYYRENTNTILNNEERDSYVKEYIEQISVYANEYDMTIEDYAVQELKLQGDAMEQLTRRAEEDFIFKVIAIQKFEQEGGRLDADAYEEFIQRNVLQNGADEIEIRDQFPYVKFKNMMPEMALSQEIFEYFSDQFRFKIDPEAELRF